MLGGLLFALIPIGILRHHLFRILGDPVVDRVAAVQEIGAVMF